MTTNTEVNRYHIVFAITLVTNYSEDYLKGLSDEKLFELYKRYVQEKMK